MSKRNLAALMAALVLAACSGARTEPGERSLLGSPGPGAKADKGKSDARKKERRKARNKVEDLGGAAGVAAQQPSAIEGDVDVPGADEEQAYPNGTARVSEPQPDGKKQGITPDYPEVLDVTIEGLGENFRITITTNGEIPQQMPNDKTIMVISFQLFRSEKEGYAFAAQATDKGWKPFAGGKDKQTKFPGTFEVTGNQIVMVVPWSYVNGAYPFKWLAASNWFQSLANTTHYIFDLVPSKNQANFPG